VGGSANGAAVHRNALGVGAREPDRAVNVHAARYRANTEGPEILGLHIISTEDVAG
jgi:hypothetical protein